MKTTRSISNISVVCTTTRDIDIAVGPVQKKTKNGATAVAIANHTKRRREQFRLVRPIIGDDFADEGVDFFPCLVFQPATSVSGEDDYPNPWTLLRPRLALGP